MGKNLKPGQRCTNSQGVCGGGHYYHKPFDRPDADNPNCGGRCSYVQPAPPPRVEPLFRPGRPEDLAALSAPCGGCGAPLGYQCNVRTHYPAGLFVARGGTMVLVPWD